MANTKKEVSAIMFEGMNKALARYEIKATPEFLKEIIKDSDFEKFLIEESEGFDTMEREWFMDTFTTKLVGMEWPCNGDSEEYANNFYITLGNKIRETEGLEFID